VADRSKHLLQESSVLSLLRQVSRAVPCANAMLRAIA